MHYLFVYTRSHELFIQLGIRPGNMLLYRLSNIIFRKENSYHMLVHLSFAFDSFATYVIQQNCEIKPIIYVASRCLNVTLMFGKFLLIM